MRLQFSTRNRRSFLSRLLLLSGASGCPQATALHMALGSLRGGAFLRSAYPYSFCSVRVELLLRIVRVYWMCVKSVPYKKPRLYQKSSAPGTLTYEIFPPA
jgi:hypothetical protein